jgi:hypothetical protein
VTPTQFLFGNVSASAQTVRRPQYVTAAVQSVSIALTAVNGSPVSPVPVATSNVNLTTCPCTVAGPAVPAGSDAFTLTAFDGQNATGNVISTASPTLTIVSGQTNSESITLNGVPASFTVAAPAATAGTAFNAAQPVGVTALDANGHVIMGTYANPVTLASTDTTGATTLTTSGTDSPAAGQLLSSGDTAQLTYTGLAVAPIAIHATASGATPGSGSFAPGLQPIVTTLTGATPQILLSTFATSASFSASEVGWTNAPFNRALTLAAAPGCATIGTVSPSSGTAFSATVAATPVQGVCAVTITDFSGGQMLAANFDYTSGSQTFAYTGAPQAFTLPSTVTVFHVVASGAGGGSASMSSSTLGVGAVVMALLPLSDPALTITIGGLGGSSVTASAGSIGGYPDGGSGGGGPSIGAGGGGGSTTVAVTAGTLVVAGGGGGPSRGAAGGGNGGAPNGSNGTTNAGSPNGTKGFGGTQVAGGAGGTAPSGSTVGSAGSGHTGGAGGHGAQIGGGGGGGGYFGGGGGGGGTNDGGGGGGGSSFVTAAGSSITYSPAGSATNGSVTISW